MQAELASLLSVKFDHLDGLFKEVACTPSPPNVLRNFRFYYVRIQDGVVREKDVQRFLRSCITPYCLSRKVTDGTIEPLDVADLFLAAKGKFQSLGAGKRRGEPGEVLAYALSEGALGAPRVIAKMGLKTNPQMPVHGADGVHIGSSDGREFDIHFLESKLYARYDQAIDDAIASVRASLEKDEEGASAQDFEIDLVEEHLDVPEGELRDFLVKLLNPYKKERDHLRYVHTCLIGFDVPELGRRLDDDFEAAAMQLAEKCAERMCQKIEDDESLRDVRWTVFFVPFSSVNDFRNGFLEMLGASGV